MAEGHRYTVRCEWTGSTAEGYDAYEREHHVTAPPARAGLRVSSDPHFLGDPNLLNPEQLVVIAASSCQLMSFLAVAARARLDVVAYDDDAEGVMPKATRLGEPMWITQIVLRPTITVALHATGGGMAGTEATTERVRHLVEVAHRECFIANSLRSEVRVEPVIRLRANPA